MKTALFLLLAAAPLPALAQNPVVSSKVTPDGEYYVVADKALAKIVFFRDQICEKAAKARAAYDAAYGSVAVGEATAETLEEMLPKLKEAQTLKASCDQNAKAAAERVDVLLGKGSGARLRSSTAFEGKVSLALNPLPKPASKDDEETWRRIEEGWKHGAACP